jgi:hypothetical protein
LAPTLLGLGVFNFIGMPLLAFARRTQSAYNIDCFSRLGWRGSAPLLLSQINLAEKIISISDDNGGLVRNWSDTCC